MMRLLPDLILVLQQLVTEHESLLRHVLAYQAAMRALDLRAMDVAAGQQEACRLRIAALESRRKGLVGQIGRLLRVEGDLTLARLAELSGESAGQMMAQRERLKALAQEIARRTHVAGRLAAALLGHLNTVVRLIAGAVEQAGVYTRHGVPQVSSRIGVMEAVG
jgi:hypothetical protein